MKAPTFDDAWPAAEKEFQIDGVAGRNQGGYWEGRYIFFCDYLYISCRDSRIRIDDTRTLPNRQPLHR